MLDEQNLRRLIADVKQGAMSRRSFIKRMAAAGIAAPAAGQLLAWNDVAWANATLAYKPTKAGGGGPLKILLWQAPTLLNPHFANGTKDAIASRIFFEPLAGWDKEGNLIPQLAAEVPSKANGGLSADGTSVVWRLKPDVKWHDGKPFSADDVVFTWEFAADPESATYSHAIYRDIRVEKIDDLTVKVIFPNPRPFWAEAFVSSGGQILPKHAFAPYKGAKSREAPANLKPIGTGPYVFVDFKPGDIVLGERNPHYHVKNQPHFDTIEVKGGGDAVSAARAVLQTGEYDYAWNLQVEDEVLKRMETGGRGRISAVSGGNIEFIRLNPTDPWTEVDGERSSIKTKHPTLSDPKVREAINLLIDRASVERFIYGRGGVATANFINEPKRFASPNLSYEFNVEKANALLEEAGYRKGADGVREKDGRKLKYVFQTSINAPRQKTQAIIKQACQRAGIEVEIKATTASVFFSSDAGNPETLGKFYVDWQMFTLTQTQPDPASALDQFATEQIASKENKWLFPNAARFSNPVVDELRQAVKTELDPVKRTALLIKANDIICQSHFILPIIARKLVAAAAHSLMIDHSGWDADTWNLAAWYRNS